MANKLYSVPDTHDWSIFRQNLRDLMDSHGYNMSELAERADLNVTSISRYLQGRVPDLIATMRIADHFGITIDWLIGRSPQKHNSLTQEELDIISKYSKASQADKDIVKLFLSKYND